MASIQTHSPRPAVVNHSELKAELARRNLPQSHVGLAVNIWAGTKLLGKAPARALTALRLRVGHELPRLGLTPA